MSQTGQTSGTAEGFFVIKVIFRDEGFCEYHRSAVVRQCDEREHVESRDQNGGAGEPRVEGLKVQGEECVRDGEGGLSKNVTRKKAQMPI